MLYRYLKEKDLKFSIRMSDNNTRYIYRLMKNHPKYIIEYESAVKTGVKENDIVYSELHLPERFRLTQFKSKNVFQLVDCWTGSLKVIILVHGFNAVTGKLKDYYYFIKKAVQNKYAVIFLHLPFHLNRTPAGEKSGQRLITNKDSQMLKFFDQSVQDIEKVISVLSGIFINSKEPGSFIDDKTIKAGGFSFSATRFYICGLSLGGMVSTIAAAWEPLLEKSILIQAGGNWDEIYWNSAIRIILRGTFINKEKIKRKAAKEFYSALPDFLKIFKSTEPSRIDSELSEYPLLSAYPQKTWFLSDPLTFAHRISPEKVLMINSKYDFLFSRKSVELLREELGMPQILWLNSFHGSRILRNKAVLKKIFDFIEK